MKIGNISKNRTAHQAQDMRDSIAKCLFGCRGARPPSRSAAVLAGGLSAAAAVAIHGRFRLPLLAPFALATADVNIIIIYMYMYE
jgi:hypothetical protein